MIAHVSQFKEGWKAYADTLRPLPRYSPAEFAAKYRHLNERETEQPGPWRNEHFPYLAPVMDSVEVAMQQGKRGWCMMKSAQGGGSQAVQNIYGWLESYYPGPIGWMTSKDEIATEFGRVRFGHMLDTMEPLKRKALRGKVHGETLTKKRFTDGFLALFGGQSVLNLQSIPYRFFIIDEVDSLLDEIKNAGDPIDLARQRMKSYTGETLLLAFAHPSTRDRGAANLYYNLSDQQRGFVKCLHCKFEFWLQWPHVQVFVPEGRNKQQAERDPRNYHYHCPSCGAQISDAERVMMIGAVEYKSELPPAEAAMRPWLGVHFSQLYMPNLTLRSIAEEFVAAIDNDAKMRVFYNKVLGEPYESKIQKISAAEWRKLIVIARPGKHTYRGRELDHDPEAYVKGQVPPGVRFLTAGQDSRNKELHYSVWGWGLCRTLEKYLMLRGWLIDWGVIKRANAVPVFSKGEYHVFDDLIYRRYYSTTYSDDLFNVLQCGHDTMYAPTQIPIHGFCRAWPGRAIPVLGAGLTASSANKAPYLRWGAALKFKIDEMEVRDESSKPLVLNTYRLKVDLYGMAKRKLKIVTPHGEREIWQITLPSEVDSEFVDQMANEVMKKDKHGHDVWDRDGPNHYADTATYAFATALNIDPFQEALPFEEAEAQREEEQRRRSQPAQPGMTDVPGEFQRERF